MRRSTSSGASGERRSQAGEPSPRSGCPRQAGPEGEAARSAQAMGGERAGESSRVGPGRSDGHSGRGKQGGVPGRGLRCRAHQISLGACGLGQGRRPRALTSGRVGSYTYMCVCIGNNPTEECRATRGNQGGKRNVITHGSNCMKFRYLALLTKIAVLCERCDLGQKEKILGTCSASLDLWHAPKVTLREEGEWAPPRTLSRAPFILEGRGAGSGAPARWGGAREHAVRCPRCWPSAAPLRGAGGGAA